MWLRLPSRTTCQTPIDASAILALLQAEPGADEVEALLDGALMSCVNLAEVLQKVEQHGVPTDGLEYDLEALGIEFRDFELPMARPTAEAWSPGAGLSLGDRTCLALTRCVRDRGHHGRSLGGRRWPGRYPGDPVAGPGSALDEGTPGAS
jgi:ribonuclease VapC